MPNLLPSPNYLKSHPNQIPDAVEQSLETARSLEHLRAFITLLDERAKTLALAVRDALLRGENLPLGGWLIAVKDNIAIKDVPLTCASKILEGLVSVYTATAVERLERAGAIVIGKTNMDEFAMGSSSETSYYGAVRNPLDPERVAGGSSGGSAVAVATGVVHGALGSDTGGSVRLPASFCGISALKPTYGRVSRYGLVAYGSSLDQIAPFAKTAKDLFDLICVMSGLDKMDSSSASVPTPVIGNGLKPLARKLRIGLPKEYFVEGLSADVRKTIENVANNLARNGHEIIDISLPYTEYGIPAYYIIAPAEASSNLARFDGVRYGFRDASGESIGDLYELTRGEGFGIDVRRRIMIGTYALSAGYYDAYYKKAQQVRRLIGEDFQRAFQNVDVILAPTVPYTAFKMGEKLSDPLSMYLSDVFTVTMNLAGIPACSVPAGKDFGGLPIGAQIIGPHFSEELILQLGAEVESLSGEVTA